jgi:hypothetical protein
MSQSLTIQSLAYVCFGLFRSIRFNGQKEREGSTTDPQSYPRQQAGVEFSVPVGSLQGRTVGRQNALLMMRMRKTNRRTRRSCLYRVQCVALSRQLFNSRQHLVCNRPYFGSCVSIKAKPPSTPIEIPKFLLISVRHHGISKRSFRKHSWKPEHWKSPSGLSD